MSYPARGLLFCYQDSPIDWWTGMLLRDDLLAVASDDDLGEELDRILDAAKLGFRHQGWDGDISAGPYFFALPDDSSTRLGVCLKQPNNGTTFVASPIRLSWYEGELCAPPVCVRIAGTMPEIVELRVRPEDRIR